MPVLRRHALSRVDEDLALAGGLHVDLRAGLDRRRAADLDGHGVRRAVVALRRERHHAGGRRHAGRPRRLHGVLRRHRHVPRAADLGRAADRDRARRRALALSGLDRHAAGLVHRPVGLESARENLRVVLHRHAALRGLDLNVAGGRHLRAVLHHDVAGLRRQRRLAAVRGDETLHAVRPLRDLDPLLRGQRRVRGGDHLPVDRDGLGRVDHRVAALRLDLRRVEHLRVARRVHLHAPGRRLHRRAVLRRERAAAGRGVADEHVALRRDRRGVHKHRARRVDVDVVCGKDLRAGLRRHGRALELHARVRRHLRGVVREDRARCLRREVAPRHEFRAVDRQRGRRPVLAHVERSAGRNLRSARHLDRAAVRVDRHRAVRGEGGRAADLHAAGARVNIDRARSAGLRAVRHLDGVPRRDSELLAGVRACHLARRLFHRERAGLDERARPVNRDIVRRGRERHALLAVGLRAVPDRDGGASARRLELQRPVRAGLRRIDRHAARRRERQILPGLDRRRRAGHRHRAVLGRNLRLVAVRAVPRRDVRAVLDNHVAVARLGLDRQRLVRHELRARARHDHAVLVCRAVVAVRRDRRRAGRRDRRSVLHRHVLARRQRQVRAGTGSDAAVRIDDSRHHGGSVHRDRSGRVDLHPRTAGHGRRARHRHVVLRRQLDRACRRRHVPAYRRIFAGS